MSDDYVTETRRRLKALAFRAVAAAKTATAAGATALAAARTATAAAKPPEPSELSPTADDADAPDERDAKIASLEQELEAERAKNEEHIATIKALEFKLDVLERSYGKQLADARAEGDAARQELADAKTRLAETTQELQQVTAVRDRLRDMLSFDGRRVPPEMRERRDEDTIARLLSMANALPDASASGAEPTREPAGEPPQPEPESGELLAPELVFGRDDGEGDHDDERNRIPGARG